MPGDRELDRDAKPVQRRIAGADQAHRRHRSPRTPDLVVVLRRLHRDVVSEPPGLLVGVRVTADVHEQRRVVDDRPLLLVEPDPFGEPQRDQALPEHVLHRLPEAEIDPKRESRHELCQPNLP